MLQQCNRARAPVHVSVYAQSDPTKHRVPSISSRQLVASILLGVIGQSDHIFNDTMDWVHALPSIHKVGAVRSTYLWTSLYLRPM